MYCIKLDKSYCNLLHLPFIDAAAVVLTPDLKKIIIYLVGFHISQAITGR
jgi:hypothetical protein